MAQPVSPPVGLDLVSVKTLVGITAEDARELEDLGYGSIADLMAAMDEYKGDLNRISTKAIVIDKDQGARIGDAVLDHPEVPDSFKKRYTRSTPVAPAADGVAVVETAADAGTATAKVGALHRIWDWKPFAG